MRQHAIPQNVLDVEFKLFTKFTLKEFAYLAIGIGFGGVMIYLTVSHIIPPMLGVPVCIITSAAGIFLGLVPINDQDADKFIQSYISAINNPTQRAWLNKKMKAERIKPLVNPEVNNQLTSTENKTAKPKIIGAGINTINTFDEKNQESKVANDDEMDILQTKETLPIDPNYLLITNDNISNYQFPAKGMENLPGNINLWICTKDYKPIPNTITYLKDKDGKILYANKTGPNGYFLTNKIWENGNYVLDFQHPQYKFPTVEIVLTNQSNRLPIKINSL